MSYLSGSLLTDCMSDSQLDLPFQQKLTPPSSYWEKSLRLQYLDMSQPEEVSQYHEYGGPDKSLQQHLGTLDSTKRPQAY